MHPETIVDFCGFLRENGFCAGVIDTLSAVEIGRALEYAEIPVVQHGLKAAFCASRDEWTAFDALFARFLAGDRNAATRQPRNRHENAAAFLLLNGIGSSSSRAVTDEARNGSGASLYERLSRTDLSTVKREDQSALEQIARRIFERAASRLSRRLRMRGRRAALDFRRTIHRACGTVASSSNFATGPERRRNRDW